MGVMDSLMSWLGMGGKKMNVVVVGLDNSGKTTIIERLKPKAQQSLEVAPTVGFTVDEFQRGALTFTVFDMSGAGRYRPLWEQYYRDAHAVIFVVDSADRYRLIVAKDEMDTMLANKELRKVPLLFFANKKDLPTAMSPVDIAHTLRLEDIKDRPLQICPSDALTGEGVDAGTQWLAEQLMKKR